MKEKTMFFVIRRSKQLEEVSYGKSETAILVLKVWSSFLEYINVIGQYLVGESFGKKTTLDARARDFVNKEFVTRRWV